MKQKTGKTKDEILAFRVEILDSQWQENKTPEERIIQQKVNERLDGWLKQISGEQRDRTALMICWKRTGNASSIYMRKG